MTSSVGQERSKAGDQILYCGQADDRAHACARQESRVLLRECVGPALGSLGVRPLMNFCCQGPGSLL